MMANFSARATMLNCRRSSTMNAPIFAESSAEWCSTLAALPGVARTLSRCLRQRAGLSPLR